MCWVQLAHSHNPLKSNGDTMETRRTVLILLIVYLNARKGMAVTISNNKYNLIVAIQEEIKQDPEIIEEIKSMFDSGSEILYKITNNRVYFGHVKILVPNSWTRDPTWSAAGTETFQGSDIRVDRGHVSHGTDPYTFHSGQCGETGRYIHLTDQYLTDQNGYRDRDYGDTGSTLVHEFAHLRYGVFDEYGLGTDEHPFVYLHEDRWLPTGCSSTSSSVRDISSYESDTISQLGFYSGDCRINVTTLKPDPSCFFVSDEDSNSSSLSIMYHSFSEKLHFCENKPENADYLYNTLAPNQHNKMCNGRGTWNVIMEHPDFLTLNSSVNITSVTPTFSVLYSENAVQDVNHVLYQYRASEPATETVGEISIDSTANREVLFRFVGQSYGNCYFALTSPLGSTFTETSIQCITEEKKNTVDFSFEFAKVGIWAYTAVCNRPEIISLIVTSRSTDRDAYQVESWLSSPAYDVTKGDNPIVVYVHVHKGYSPVIDADVTVRMKRPGHVTSLTLMPSDDGQLPDNMPNDGVYTAFITQFTDNGSYPLEVEVVSIEETYYYLSGPSLYGGAESRYHNTTPAVVLVPAENFTRSSSPGAVDVTGYTPNADNFPPIRVTDLNVIDFNSTLKEMTLTWTAPGDDLTRGNASRYDIRMSESAVYLRSNFTNAAKVTPDMVLFGSLIPQPAGTTEHMVIQAPLNWTTVVFALRTSDDFNNVSPSSNFAVATFEVVTTTTTMTTTTTTIASTVLTGTTGKDKSPNQFSPKKIGIILGSILGAGLLVVVFANLIKLRRKPKKLDILPCHSRQLTTVTTKNL